MITIMRNYSCISLVNASGKNIVSLCVDLKRRVVFFRLLLENTKPSIFQH